jgi:hypothetical protein
MIDLGGWELFLLAASGYVAVVTLVRMMQRRREGLIDHLAREVSAQRQKRSPSKRKIEQVAVSDADSQDQSDEP